MNTFLIFQALRLDGRTALVTGSSKGIGRSIALALAEAGAGVIVNSRHEDDATSDTLDAARGFGVQAHFLPADLSQPGEGRRLGEAALQLAGQLDIAVSNVAVQLRTPWLDVPAEQFELQMRTNFQAAFELIQVTGTTNLCCVAINELLGLDNFRVRFLPPIFADSAGSNGKSYDQPWIRSRDDLDKMVFPDPDDPALYRDAETLIRDGGYRYAVGATLRTGISATTMSFGLEGLSYALADDPGLVATVLGRYSEWAIAVSRHLRGIGVSFQLAGDNGLTSWKLTQGRTGEPDGASHRFRFA